MSSTMAATQIPIIKVVNVLEINSFTEIVTMSSSNSKYWMAQAAKNGGKLDVRVFWTQSCGKLPDVNRQQKFLGLLKCDPVFANHRLCLQSNFTSYSPSSLKKNRIDTTLRCCHDREWVFVALLNDDKTENLNAFVNFSHIRIYTTCIGSKLLLQILIYQ